MGKKAPGRNERSGITLFEIMQLFPDDKTAEKWFEEQRWPDGKCCPNCGSTNIQENAKHKTMAHRCRDCRKFFSAKVGTVMQSSNLGYRAWAIGIYLMHTGIKGTASMKLHRDLGIAYSSAWHLSHRIRECWAEQQETFSGPVEVDETYIGGKERNKHNKKKLKAGRGGVGKSIVVGAKDRASLHVHAAVIGNTDRKTLQGFVINNADLGATVYTDEAGGYKGLPFRHKAVKHSVGEYVKDRAHTNGIESFWALLKRGYHGTYHQMSRKHLHRYVNEFAGRHNARGSDTIDQMKKAARGMNHKRLRYQDLIG